MKLNLGACVRLASVPAPVSGVTAIRAWNEIELRATRTGCSPSAPQGVTAKIISSVCASVVTGRPCSPSITLR